MFDALRDLLGIVTGREPDETFADDDARLAAAALLVHVAVADGALNPAERLRIMSLLSEGFGVPAGQADRLLAAGERRDREAASLSDFTDGLRRALGPVARARLVAMMVQVAGSDGEVSEFEDGMIARCAALLGVSGERVLPGEPA